MNPAPDVPTVDRDAPRNPAYATQEARSPVGAYPSDPEAAETLTAGRARDGQRCRRAACGHPRKWHNARTTLGVFPCIGDIASCACESFVEPAEQDGAHDG